LVIFTPGPSHWRTGEPVTPLGRETEQVRVTVDPAMMKEGEVVRLRVAGSIVISTGVSALGSVLELATTPMEYVAPAVSPVMVTLVSSSSAVREPPWPSSLSW
jgi:hypothetical protein